MEFLDVPVNLSVDRNKFIKTLNERIGQGDWFWVFRVGKRVYSWNLGMQIYEDAYLDFFKRKPKLIKTLVDYSNLYVYDRHDVDSGLDYRKQTQPKDHFEDIAIRRCLARLGVGFRGLDYIRVPGSEFDPTRVKFHLPHLILKPDSLPSIQSWFSNRMIAVVKTVEDKAKLAEILVK